jgi:tRNA (guanine-N7-)-methyltransferase
MARAFPERRFLGTERLLGRVRGTCRRLRQAGLTNAKVLRLESRYTVEWLLPADSVSRLHLLYPDPWPKPRHHRRRLVQRQFLDAVQRVLAPGGEFLFKTDDAAYHAWTEEQLAACGHFARLPWPDDAFYYPPTDFEELWRAQGKTLFRIRCKAVSSQR